MMLLLPRCEKTRTGFDRKSLSSNEGSHAMAQSRMMTTRRSRLPVWFARLAGAGLALTVTLPSAVAQTGVHVPPAGSAERKEISDALRATGDNRNRVFVVSAVTRR